MWRTCLTGRDPCWNKVRSSHQLELRELNIKSMWFWLIVVSNSGHHLKPVPVGRSRSAKMGSGLVEVLIFCASWIVGVVGQRLVHTLQAASLQNRGNGPGMLDFMRIIPQGLQLSNKFVVLLSSLVKQCLQVRTLFFASPETMMIVYDGLVRKMLAVDLSGLLKLAVLKEWTGSVYNYL